MGPLTLRAGRAAALGECSERTAAVRVRGLIKSYVPERRVLSGVDLDAWPGEVLCLLGPNGSGKTTTLEILQGFRRRDEGAVSVLGLDPESQPRELRERVGVVPQEGGFPRFLRVGELIEIFRSYYPRPLTFDAILDLVELRPQADMLVRRLSGGQRRRLDFALATVGDPDLIFLDEPTTGFDPESRARCWQAISGLRELGKTIILTTHYLDEAELLADSVAILHKGRICARGSVSDILQAADLGARVEIRPPASLRPALRAHGLKGRTAVLGGIVSDVRPILNLVVREGLKSERSPIGERPPAVAPEDADQGLWLNSLRLSPATLEDAYLRLVGEPAGGDDT